MERTTQPRSADRSASSRYDRHPRGLHSSPTPAAEPFELRQSLDPVVTLSIGYPLTRVEAIDLKKNVRALIAQRPAAIVLDVAGLMPTDEMGMLMLPSVAHDAAEEGVTVVVANPSRPLRDRLAELGVPNLTFVYCPAPTASPEDEWDDEANDPNLTFVYRPAPTAPPQDEWDDEANDVSLRAGTTEMTGRTRARAKAPAGSLLKTVRPEGS